MWFGDAVTLRAWPDIWLHEGFATWSEWIWSEHQGGKSAAQRFKQLVQHPGPARPPSGTRRPATPATPALHVRRDDLQPRRHDAAGAAREDRRRHVLRDPAPSGSRSTATATSTTAQFVALAEQVSGQDLTAFFDIWLYQPGKPAVLTDAAAAPAATAQRH